MTTRGEITVTVQTCNYHSIAIKEKQKFSKDSYESHYLKALLARSSQVKQTPYNKMGRVIQHVHIMLT